MRATTALSRFLVGILLVASAGCTSSTDRSDAASVSSDDSQATEQVGLDEEAMLTCEGSVEIDAVVPEQYEIILDDVALPTAVSSAPPLQAVRQPESEGPRYFAKAGLLLRADAVVHLEIVDAVGHSELGWGSPSNPDKAVSGSGCGGEQWAAYPGGFYVDELQCIDVTVEKAGQSQTVQVGVGAACDGQAG